MSVLFALLLLCSLDNMATDEMNKTDSCYFYENLNVLKRFNKGCVFFPSLYLFSSEILEILPRCNH